MAWSDDLLEGMEDVKQVSTMPAASPGDLSALAAAAARLAVQKEGEEVTREKAERRQRRNSPPAPRRNSPPSPRREAGERKAAEEERPRDGRPRLANSALPHDMHFTVPLNCRPGQPVCVQGPHGPLHMPLPQGYQPGERCKVRFGPSEMHQVVVPQGKQPGDVVKFPGPDDVELEARVPPGMGPGDVFEVSPPVMMVQVPPGVRPGDAVCFAAADGTQRTTLVPKGLKEGQYFPSLFGTCNQESKEASLKEGLNCSKEEPPLIDLM